MMESQWATEERLDPDLVLPSQRCMMRKQQVLSPQLSRQAHNRGERESAHEAGAVTPKLSKPSAVRRDLICLVS
jgi:hypothetical protein